MEQQNQGLAPSGNEGVAHTPGPWKVAGTTKEPLGFRAICVTPVNSDKIVAECQYHSDHPERHVTAEANARLIAAAPDLLAACKLVLDLLERGILVRDISKDAGPNWALGAMSLVQDMNKILLAVHKAEGIAARTEGR